MPGNNNSIISRIGCTHTIYPSYYDVSGQHTLDSEAILNIDDGLVSNHIIVHPTLGLKPYNSTPYPMRNIS